MYVRKEFPEALIVSNWIEGWAHPDPDQIAGPMMTRLFEKLEGTIGLRGDYERKPRGGQRRSMV